MKFKQILFLVFFLFLFSNLFSANYYWVGGSGYWSDIKHWATTSGGSINHLQVPSPTDDVYFDSKSFLTSTDTVIVNVGNAVCRDMDWSGATNVPSFLSTNNFRVYGSLKLISAMKWLLSGSLSFEATSVGKTITTANNLLGGDVVFNGIGGEWILQDSLLMFKYNSSSIIMPSSGILYLNNGHLNTNGKGVVTRQFNSTSTNIRQLTIANSTIRVLNNWQVEGAKLTLNALNSRIIPSNFNHQGEKKTYYDVYFENGGSFNSRSSNYHTVTVTGVLYGYNGGNNKYDSLIMQSGIDPSSFAWMNILNNDTIGVLVAKKLSSIGSGCKIGTAYLYDKSTITGSNVYDTLLFFPGGSYVLASNGTQQVNNHILATGTCTANITIESGTSGVKANLSKSSGTVTFNYVSLKDINATGGAAFTANNSANLGNNSGWTINSAASLKLYWVGGAGNWNDPNHWSTQSGGAGGACLPTANDDVYFDSKSFLTSTDTVIVNVGNAVCRDMDWSGATNVPSFLSTNNFRVYGSLKLISAMKWLLSGSLSFEATSVGKTITTANNLLGGDVVFNGIGGEWILQDSLLMFKYNSSSIIMPSSGILYLNNGHLNTNGKGVVTRQFNSTSTNIRQLTIANSTIRVLNNWQVEGAKLTLNALNSRIIPSNFNHQGEKKTYYDVYFENGGSFNSRSSNYHTVTVTGVLYGYNGGNNKYDSLIMQSGIDPSSFAWMNILNNDTIGVLVAKKLSSIGSGCKIGTAYLYDKSTITGSNVYDTLLLFPGGSYYLGANAVQTINDSLSIRGNGCFPITLQSTNAGVQSTISYAKTKIVGDYIEMRDQKAIGGAQFYAGSFSTNVSNNTGWNFNNAPDYKYGLGDDTTFCGILVPFVLSTDNFNGGIAWKWQDGSTNPTYKINQPGKYYVDVMYASTCYIADTINVTVTTDVVLNPTIKIETPATNFCEGTSTTFTAIATDYGNLPVYQWKINGINVGANSAKFTSANLKNADTVTCTITTNSACKVSKSVVSNSIIVTVVTSTPPSVSIAASANNICIGSSVSFTATSANAGVAPTYQWRVNGININETGSIFTSSTLLNNDVISLVMTSNTVCATGGVTNSNGITMIVRDKVIPSVSISTPLTTICEGSSVMIRTNTLNGGTAPKYQWKLNGMNAGTDSIYISTTLKNGDIVTTEMVSNNTCVTTNIAISNSLNFTIINKLVPSVSINASAANICAGASITYTAASANGGTSPFYQWMVNSVNVGTNSNVFSSTQIKNGDIITVRLTSDLSCVTQSTVVSNNITTIVNPLVSPTVKINASSLIICKGTQVDFSLTSTNAGNNPTYQWKINNNNVSSLPSFSSATLSNNDIVSVHLTSNANCLSGNTANDNVTISVPVLNQPVVTAGVIGDFSIEFNWSALSGATRYQVSIDGGNTFTDPSSGPSGTRHNLNGLSPDFPVTIIVKAIGVIPCITSISNPYTARTTINKVLFVANAFTPNGDGKNDYFIVSGTLTDVQLKIFNQWGALLFSSNSQSVGWDGTKDGKPQPAGPYSYYLQAVLRDGTKIVQKGNFTLLR